MVLTDCSLAPDSFSPSLIHPAGMRGCVSGGALQAISDFGLKNAFDAESGVQGQPVGLHP